MDLFKLYNNYKATSYDFYDNAIKQNSKTKSKDKKMLHKLSRAKLKRNVNKYNEGE